MDGYKATYTIRNAAPFALNPDIQGTPIVAMTASAIQGDKEKCQSAGMDDYLAKPVKKPNLEKMLVKWAIEGRKKRAELKKNPSLLKARTRPSNPRNNNSFTSEGSSAMNNEELLTSELDRLEVYQSTIAQSSESAGERALRQQAAEEQAIALRDHELMEAGEDPKTRLGKGLQQNEDSSSQQEPILAPSALTAENMQRFAMSDPKTALLKRALTGGEGDDRSSMMATRAETGSHGVETPTPTATPPPPSRQTTDEKRRDGFGNGNRGSVGS